MRNGEIGNENSHIAVGGFRPYDHIPILVDTPSAEWEPSATYQLYHRQRCGAMKEGNLTSGPSLELVYPPVEGK